MCARSAALSPFACPPAGAAEPAARGCRRGVGATTINLLGITDLHGHISGPLRPTAVPGDVRRGPRCRHRWPARSPGPARPTRTRCSSPRETTSADRPTSRRLLDDQPHPGRAQRHGPDVSALGNHELDKGLDDLRARILPAAYFPYLSANVTGSAPGAPRATATEPSSRTSAAYGRLRRHHDRRACPPSSPRRRRRADPESGRRHRQRQGRRAQGRAGAADVVVVLAHADAAAMAPELLRQRRRRPGRAHPRALRPRAGRPSTTTDGQDIAVVQADHYGWGLADVRAGLRRRQPEASVVGADNKDLRSLRLHHRCLRRQPGSSSEACEQDSAAEAGKPPSKIGSDFLRGSADGSSARHQPRHRVHRLQPHRRLLPPAGLAADVPPTATPRASSA